jgi:quinol monooxygenase YgiN
MYASMRTYRVGAGAIDAVLHRVDRDFAEALAQEPGFIAYQAIKIGEDRICTTSIFSDREQAEASNEIAAEWVADELSDFEIERMGVISGEVRVSRARAQMLESAHA